IDLQDAQNPAAWIDNRVSYSKGLNITSQFFAEVDIIKGLKFKTQAQVGLGGGTNWNYRKEFESANLKYGREVNEGYNFYVFPIVENFLTYDKSMGKHNFTVMAGNTYANNGRSRSVGVVGTGFPNDEIQNIGVAQNKSVSSASASTNHNARVSYFGRASYNYDNKYYAMATLRRDYSPAFGENYRYGTFPSFGLAYRIKEESFLKDVSAISDLKIRGSWGLSGNDRIGLFQTTVSTFQGFNPGSVGYSTGDGKNFSVGTTVAGIGNPNLKWEETEQWDLGFDLGLLSNKLNVTYDYYNRFSRDLLVRQSIETSTGLGDPYNSANIPTNAASVLNRGSEVNVTYRDKRRGFSYGANVNFSYNFNEVKALGAGSAPIRSGTFNDVANPTKTDVGAPLGAFWGYRVDHVAINTADVDKYNAIAKAKGKAEFQKGLKPGDIIFKDIDGDGQVNEADQEVLGSAIPKFQYGGNIDLGYKNFDLMISLTGVKGVQIFNSSIYYLEGTNKVFNHGVGVLDRWKKEGDVAKNPKAGQGANGNLNLRASDRFVEDGSYLRFRNLTLGYNIPMAKLGNVSKTIGNARLSFTLQNFITITKFSGLDPEILNISGDTNDPRNSIFTRGISGYTPPVPKTWLVSLNLGF
ncbi:MAG: SusC/RagA family TonB-linked outer membrane protein, partial [Leadbetterella sp.]